MSTSVPSSATHLRAERLPERPIGLGLRPWARPSGQTRADRLSTDTCGVKQSQFPTTGPDRPWVHEGRAAEPKRAKQSQLVRGQNEEQVLDDKGFMAQRTRRGRRQNKANFHADGRGQGQASPHPTSGAGAPNKANFPPGGRGKTRPLAGPSTPDKANWHWPGQKDGNRTGRPHYEEKKRLTASLRTSGLPGGTPFDLTAWGVRVRLSG